MQPPTSNPPTKLKIRAYECRLTARKVKLGLEKLVESSPAFNESWLLGEYDIGSRIGGLGQYGDIIIRHRTVLRGKHELTIEHRAGDELLAKEIEAAYGKDLTPKAPRMIKGKKRPHGMAYFFETIRGASLIKNHVIITDAVIEEAHDLNFDDYREARSKLEFLGMVPRLGALHSNLDIRVQRAYKEANQLYACPKVCLYQGKKLALPHRMEAISVKHDFILTLHFAKLTGLRVLVGWVEERQF
jgi:hypothetical protein